MAELPTPAIPRTRAHAKPRVIALIAHDNKKQDLVDWCRFNMETLREYSLVGTGTTGGLIERELGLPIEKLHSGPLGGDQQIGAKIAQGEIDMVVFFWDPLAPHPHDVDVKALLRIAVVYDIPMACNRSSADFIISSPLMIGPGFQAPHTDAPHTDASHTDASAPKV